MKNSSKDFFDSVWKGLNASPKYLQSRYFYDAEGDELFREIMNCPEYYLTRCEMEIFSSQSHAMRDIVLERLPHFDVVELGPGDCSKSIHLLQAIAAHNPSFTYYPIDISKHVLAYLGETLPEKLPTVEIQGLNGDYFDMLKKLATNTRNKLVLFLGSSIGNIPAEQTTGFFTMLRGMLQPGDMLLTGFDLKKALELVLAAYNDMGGITRRFNLNLLKRINRELDADFNIDQFEHAPQYDEASGACRSYLVSKSDQRVRIGEEGWVYFSKGESIFMEISQKYDVAQTDAFAASSGFEPVRHFFDSKHWFLDALWQVV
jgi:L-histidine Nalpha-methyltransferase